MTNDDAGRSCKKTMFRYPIEWISRLSICIIFAGILYVKFRSVKVASLAPLISLYFYLLERRRKLNIFEDSIAYTPPVGPTKCAKFADVTSIKRAPVAVSYGLGFPGIAKGAELQLSNYMAMQIPLDLANGDEVFELITKAWERSHDITKQR